MSRAARSRAAVGPGGCDGQQGRVSRDGETIEGRLLVAADGSLNGNAGGLDRKEWLLRLGDAYEE